MLFGENKIKIKLLITISCLISLLISVQTICLADQNEDFNKAFRQAFEQAAKQGIEDNKKFMNCTPASSDKNMKVFGITNGSCHFYRGFYKIEGKQYPMDDCYVPMNVLKQILQKENDMLSKGYYHYDSSKDPYTPYCKRMHNTVKTNYGSVSY